MAEIKAILNKRVPALFALIVSVTLVIYNTIRILKVPITVDEPCYSATESYWALMMEPLGHANNHVFHSILRKFFVEHLGYSTFSMRVDNLLALILFLIFSWLLCKQLFWNRWWQLCSFVFLNTISPFLFDFWGLSRGYGLALMFMTSSIYFFIRYINNHKALPLAISFGAAILAVYSNFSHLNYYVSLLASIVLLRILFRNAERKRLNIWLELLVMFLATTLLLLLIYEPLKNIYLNGELSFMGSNGFIDDTIVSLASEGFYLQASMAVASIITWTSIVLFYISGGYWVFNYIKKSKSTLIDELTLKYGIALYLLLAIPVISLIVQHLILHTNYLTDRAALFFIVLFSLQFIYWLYHISSFLPKISWGIFLCVCVFSVYYFSSVANVRFAYHWWFNQDDHAVLQRMVDNNENKGQKIKACVTWLFIMTFRYDTAQIYPGKFEQLENFSNTSKKDTSFDYYYLATSEPRDSLLPWYHIDTTFCGGGFILYKKN